MPNYVEIYPPFRMDEVNYYTIARNIISGNIYREGSIERSFSIGFPLAAVPFVMVWDTLGCYLANTLIVWMSLIMFFLTIRRYVTCTLALLMTSLLAFATIEWFYAVSCYTEPLAQLLVLSGFYFLTWKESCGRSVPDASFVGHPQQTVFRQSAMPILLLFPAGLGRMWRKGLKSEMLLILTSVLIIVLFIASSPYPFTQFGIGSRHIVPILPLLFFPSIFFFHR